MLLLVGMVVNLLTLEDWPVEVLIVGMMKPSSGATPIRRGLAENAAWLAGLVTHYLPEAGAARPARPDAAAPGSRQGAVYQRQRVDSAPRSGSLVVGQPMSAEGIRLIKRAAAMRRPGPCQIEAAIVACHAEAASWAATDWRQIVLLYDLLHQLTPSPIVRLNRAVALRQIEGPEAALRNVDVLAADLENYHLYHAIRGELLLELSQREQARPSALRALQLTHNHAEQSLLTRRLLEW